MSTEREVSIIQNYILLAIPSTSKRHIFRNCVERINCIITEWATFENQTEFANPSRLFPLSKTV